ncbi:MAG: immunoglobulin domain-containing protein [Chloroflexi bacterium]|nr:immunoglobulin domain-containing protein [Chloroflexota bacterium]
MRNPISFPLVILRWLALLHFGGIQGLFAAEGPPVITSQPQSQIVSSGSSVTFSAGATGTAPLTFQWQKDGSDLL